MKIYNFFALIILSLGFLLNGAANAQSKNNKTSKKTKTQITKSKIKPVPKPPIDNAAIEYKILLEGSQSKIETPFIFVARDAETYAEMRALIEGLPASSTIDFSKTAVVAAFAGIQNTGGFLVAVHPAFDKTSIELKTPGKGVMTAQMITYPFQIAIVPVDENQGLNIEMAAAWTSAIKTYRVTKGEFLYSGGFAGRTKKFDAEGTIGVLSYGDHLTYFFNLTGKKSEKQRKMSEMASGVLKDGKIEIGRVDAGTFAENPHPPVKVTGTAGDKKLALVFDSLPAKVADGFAVRGKIEAVKDK